MSQASRCKTYPILSAMDVFSNHMTGEQLKGTTRASCKTSNAIYLTTCRRCGQQYVGETGQPLHCRINSHHFGIMHRRTEDSPVVAHVNTNAHSRADMTMMVIDQVRSHDLGKQVDQDPGDLVPFRNEPQGPLSVKPACNTRRPP